MDRIKAISVIDGRYNRMTSELTDVFSEFGLIKHRVFVEVQWLKFILNDLDFGRVSDSDIQKIDSIYNGFNAESAMLVKEAEKTTNHDVKAVEYYIKQQLSALGLDKIKEWTHFACTSEDINNTAYALMLKKGLKIITANLDELLNAIETIAKDTKSVPMMARTHGQPATPTTVGKEFVNFAWRISKELESLKQIVPAAKMNGATGCYNAHYFVFPNIDWIAAGRKFLTESLGLEPLMWTTQINPYNHISGLMHNLIRISSILIDIDRDMWGYISIGYFRQKVKKGEVGSSTMPHKVNPIDFENSEGNLGLAIPLMEHLAVKLLNSRFQRDLTDSTVLRNIGVVFAYFLIGIKSAMKGLGRLDLDKAALQKDLDENLELLAEPLQTAMRVYGEENPYEKLKELTRGAKITQADLDKFIAGLEKTPENIKETMRKLTPATYTGLAERLVDEYFSAKG